MRMMSIINVETGREELYLGKVSPDGWIALKAKEQWLSVKKYPKLAKLVSVYSADGKRFRVPARKEIH